MAGKGDIVNRLQNHKLSYSELHPMRNHSFGVGRRPGMTRKVERGVKRSNSRRSFAIGEFHAAFRQALLNFPDVCAVARFHCAEHVYA